MIIKSNQNKSSSDLGLKKTLIFLSLFLIISVYLYVTLPIFTNHQAKLYLDHHFKRNLIRYHQTDHTDFLSLTRKALLEGSVSKINSYLNNEQLPSININIDFNSWNSIKKERQAMIGRRFMGDLQKYQKAVIQFDDKEIPTKLRLKGGRITHIKKNNRWSMRIKTRKGKTFFGMKVFSLQHPDTRGYQRESVFHELARRNGLLSLKYFFIHVSINGEKQGIMAVEEVPSKEMLEREQYKEGLLYQLDDINVRRMYHSVLDSSMKDDPKLAKKLARRLPNRLYKGHYDRISRIYYNALNASIKEISRKKRSKNYQRQRPIAVGLLKALREGKITPSKIFDAKKTGLYFGYLALWGDSHNASFRNARYYFNPYTFKFEPIIYDSNAYNFNKIKLYPNNHTFRDQELNIILLSDPIILNEYLKSVEYFSNFANSKDFENKIREIEKQPLANLRDEFLFLPELNISSMPLSLSSLQDEIKNGSFYKVKNQKVNDLNDSKPLSIPPNFLVPKVLDVDLIETDSGFKLEFHNLFPLDAFVTEISIKLDGRTVDSGKYISTSLPFKVDAFYYNQFFSHNDLFLNDLPHSKNIKVKGKVILNTQNDIEYPFEINKSYNTLVEHPLASQTAKNITFENPFITQNKNGLFRIKKGEWTFKNRVILPQDSTLIIEAGTTLKFPNNAGLLVKGDVQMIGTKVNPIIFDSISDDNNNSWSGFTVMQANKRSKLDHVIFRHGDFTKHKNWLLTGAVTFYKSDVDISNSTFEDSSAEDALNIIKSDFTLINSSIKNAVSDGLDADFSTGKISHSTFSNIGGDAVDFSGSSINLSSSNFNNVHDKAISAGEATNMMVSQVNVMNSGTGVAVKDGSTLEISDSEFSKIEYSTLMSYKKKKNYGKSVLKAINIKYLKNNIAVIAQKGNQLFLDGHEITAQKININKLYQQGHMKK